MSEDNQDQLPPQSDPIEPEATLVPGACSPTLGQLFAALSEAQGDIEPAPKAATNPHFHNPQAGRSGRYADLASVREASRAALKANGLVIIQRPLAQSGRVTVETILGHKSGEWMSNTLAMPLKDSHPQAVGSAITYARRYAYCAMIGVVGDEDDDGNAATPGRDAPPPDRSKAPTPKAQPKPAPKQEPEVRTQPKSDRPPPPVPSEAFDDSDEPCPEHVSKEIGTIFRRLRMQPTETVVMCREVTGKAPKELTLGDGEKLLAHVRKLETAEKEAQAALPGNVG